MNMFKPTKAKSVVTYLAQVPEERKDLVLFLHEFIKKNVPKLKSHFAYNMLGYGSFPYLNNKKELGKVSVGKSCIRFKKLEDIHLPTLKKVLQLAAKSPGLTGAKK